MSIKRLLESFCHLNLVFLNDSLRLPIFKINPNNIYAIKSPEEFYTTLKKSISKSTQRICISSLYFGTSHLEKELIHCLSDRKEKYKELDLTILLDYNRGTRESITNDSVSGQKKADSSKISLLPLVSKGANISFYLTFKLNGWKSWIQRKQKWNELCSLHHMKLYIFDNDLVISGANLSDTYFTNRQDRYVLIKNSPLLCDYFEELIKSISKFSMFLKQDGNFKLHPDWKYDPRKYFQQFMFKKSARDEINKLNQKFCMQNENVNSLDTVVFPLLQMKSIGINDEEQFTSSLLQSLPQQSSFHISTGYFNLTKAYQTILLDHSKNNSLSILMASEEANGFFNGNGILRFIPLVYTNYVRGFLKRLPQSKDIRIWYYCRPNWSFHAKGIWLSSPDFYLTVVGSTNFGYRSVYRDNEAQIVILTKNKQLEQKFQYEHQSLVENSKPILDLKDLSKVPFWVSCFATLFRSFF